MLYSLFQLWAVCASRALCTQPHAGSGKAGEQSIKHAWTTSAFNPEVQEILSSYRMRDMDIGEPDLGYIDEAPIDAMFAVLINYANRRPCHIDIDYSLEPGRTVSAKNKLAMIALSILNEMNQQDYIRALFCGEGSRLFMLENIFRKEPVRQVISQVMRYAQNIPWHESSIVENNLVHMANRVGKLVKKMITAHASFTVHAALNAYTPHFNYNEFYSLIVWKSRTNCKAWEQAIEHAMRLRSPDDLWFEYQSRFLVPFITRALRDFRARKISADIPKIVLDKSEIRDMYKYRALYDAVNEECNLLAKESYKTNIGYLNLNNWFYIRGIDTYEVNYIGNYDKICELLKYFKEASAPAEIQAILETAEAKRGLPAQFLFVLLADAQQTYRPKSPGGTHSSDPFIANTDITMVIELLKLAQPPNPFMTAKELIELIGDKDRQMIEYLLEDTIEEKKDTHCKNDKMLKELAVLTMLLELFRGGEKTEQAGNDIQDV
ncbi:hypothetical protein PAPHI01_0811 [Pancytospora philotis]|nr:hypothetical protein PAPHI01_0811 [Pancytospora philotis]